MNRLLLLLISMQVFRLEAQESAIDYLMPTVQSEKWLIKVNTSYLSGDITQQSYGFTTTMYSVHPRQSEDGLTLKIIYFDELYDPLENYSYTVKCSGTNAQLIGYSSYVIDEGYFLDEYVSNENYAPVTSGSNYIKVPGESYQTLEWTFVNPKTNATVTGSSYYKSMTFNGSERRVLVVEFEENGKRSKEYFIKNFGLVALQNTKGELFVVDFKNFNLYDKVFMDSKSEADLRTYAWGLIKRLRAIEKDDSFYVYGNRNQKAMFNKLDSLEGLFEQMILKTPSMQNVYRYMMGIYLKSSLDKLFESADKHDKLGSKFYVIMPVLNDYFMLRPYPGYVSKSGLSTYVTGVEENYYNEYWKAQYMIMKCIVKNTDFVKSYKAYLLKPFVNTIAANEGVIGNVDKCILNSYVALYYDYLDDQVNRYHHLVMSVENYQYLSQADKDLNIEYMRTVMKNLSTLVPGNESDLNRALDATLSLKDFYNAVKIADNGYKNAVGKSLEFAFRYAEAAYNDELNKEHLRIAMRMMDGQTDGMNSTQLTSYVKYCNALSPEFDCSKAQSTLAKQQKKELKESKKRQKSGSGGSYGSSYRSANFAIMANPFAGVNLSGKDGIFNYLPMSATLRVKKTIHEVRYNPFFGFDTKSRFVYGKVGGSELEDNKGWVNLKGADYGYSLIFNKNEISSYKKTCSSVGGGVNFIYGSFTTDDEVVTATIDNIPRNIVLRPEITRYEGLITFSYNMFNWKNHLAFNFYYGIGAGVRQLKYGNFTYSQEILSDSERTVFTDKRFDQANWNGAYFSFRMGFRFGFTLF